MNKRTIEKAQSKQRGALFLVLVLLCVAILQAGCTRVTYVPISWGMEERVQSIIYKDEFLHILFSRYDPDRTTLSMQGKPFNKLMKTDTARKFQAVYRKDERRIYRNGGVTLSDEQLRNILVHEMGHHVWVNFLNGSQRQKWKDYLKKNPSPLQAMVRSTYADAKDFDTEDFAYTLEYARPTDIFKLGEIGVITDRECNQILRREHVKSRGISRMYHSLTMPNL